MDPLGDPLTTCPIQTGWEISSKPDLNRRSGCIDNTDRQFGNGSLQTRTRTRSDGPEPLLSLTNILVVLATGLGNPTAVLVWPANTGQFGSRPFQKPQPVSLSRANPVLDTSTSRFCLVWLDQSVRITASACLVFKFMVAFRYPTVNCKILTWVYH
jgi:hypothetical protein